MVLKGFFSLLVTIRLILTSLIVFNMSVASFSVSSSQTTDDIQPNIVLIVADYMGYADIEPYGAIDIKTPALNTLAAQGSKFSNHYASAPSCIPSRASLLSGLYPKQALSSFKTTRGRGLHKSDNRLLRTLKYNDYKTAAIGKWHLGSEQEFAPNDHGFDYFFGFDSWTLGYHDHLTSNNEPGLYRNKTLVNERGYLTDLFSNEASDFIDLNANSPFFLYLSYNAGLPPYQTHDLPKSDWDKGWQAEKAKRSDYVAMIERMDLGIGKVLQKLDELNLSQNTLVIFTYDHGGRHLVDSGQLFHGFGTLWEGGIRVPLIIRWPDVVAPNTIIKTPTIAMDVTATIIDSLANKIPLSEERDNSQKFDGISFLRFTGNKRCKTACDKRIGNISSTQSANTESRYLYWKTRDMKAIRHNQWKYLVDGHSQFLFNLDMDISERNNLFHQQPSIVQTLKTELALWEKD